MLEREAFLEEYNIKENFNIPWEEVEKIYEDYITIKENAEEVVDSIVKKFRKNELIHSIRARVKDPKHLIEKIIRKSSKKGINVENYKEEITDIIGVRIICLFKKDIKKIDEYIKKLDYKLVGKPEVNLRDGDDKKYYEGIGDIKEHMAGYRSVHYNLIASDSTGKKFIYEIQLRTIFEEAWGEIDHSIRYPYLQDDPYLNDYFKALNRLSGLGDEMSNFSEELVTLIEKAKKSDRVTELEKKLNESNEELRKKEKEISKLKNKLDSKKTEVYKNIPYEPSYKDTSLASNTKGKYKSIFKNHETIQKQYENNFIFKVSPMLKNHETIRKQYENNFIFKVNPMLKSQFKECPDCHAINLINYSNCAKCNKPLK